MGGRGRRPVVGRADGKGRLRRSSPVPVVCGQPLTQGRRVKIATSNPRAQLRGARSQVRGRASTCHSTFPEERKTEKSELTPLEK
ncbi:hypothetical protein Y1Q_0023074 [Alligator mississippiensis]|uniref:Uncharacterized protein n=1 Tax=Alligator mississippiensis TaxID=8496 RepID=A0A151NJW2_ALLMI|nr:hypothetical protein Y1Q_0023074 [Alligator mississippiensis]